MWHDPDWSSYTDLEPEPCSAIIIINKTLPYTSYSFNEVINTLMDLILDVCLKLKAMIQRIIFRDDYNLATITEECNLDPLEECIGSHFCHFSILGIHFIEIIATREWI